MGTETCPVTYELVLLPNAPQTSPDELTRLSNQTEIVQTYVTYLKNASSTFLHLGARVLITSPTPTNPFQSGAYSFNPTVYAYYSWYIAQSLGGPAAGIYYVPHGAYAAQAVGLLGRASADANYPMDNTHLSPYYADVFARAFVLGLKCGTAPFQGYVVNATSRMERGDVLGTCLPANATLPI
jgi:rhamnogalacturonan acetylesterase